MFNILVLTAICCLITACGVKGDPQPPLTPPKLSKGLPKYKVDKSKNKFDGQSIFDEEESEEDEE